MLGTILFDLDGTLADTAPDLGTALNAILRLEGREPISQEKIRASVSQGSRGLLQLGLGKKTSKEKLEHLNSVFIENYAEVCTQQTKPFSQIKPLIKQLVAKGLRWGIVTNKVQRFTGPLVAHLNFEPPPEIVVSGDTLIECKPSPKPLLFACEQLKIAPQTCLYVGDARRDIEAGRTASMLTAVAAWGYLTTEDKPLEWGANFILESPLDLLELITSTLAEAK
ncbi:MAG: HAD-IA family hydrolase [Neisseriaceae bacterium]